MIDFKNPSFIKLKYVKDDEGQKLVGDMLADGESIFATFKTARDTVVFTTRRVITISVQGVTGYKKCFTSLPYAKMLAYAVTTSSTLDVDNEVDLWYADIGQIHFDFVDNFDLRRFNKLLGEYVTR